MGALMGQSGGPREALRSWWAETIGERLRVWSYLPYGGLGLVAALSLIGLLLGLSPVTFMVATSAVVGRMPAAVQSGVGSPAMTGVMTAFALAAAVFVAQGALSTAQSTLAELMTRRVDGRLRGELIATSLASAGVGPLEDPAALDALAEVNRWFEGRLYTPGSACAGMLALGSRYLRLTSLIVAVGLGASWLAGLTVGLGVLVFRTGQRGGLRVFVRVYGGSVAAVLRRQDHLRDLLLGARHAKELRIFGLTGWFTQQYRDAHATSTREVNRARRAALFLPYLGYTAFGLLAACSVFVVLGTGAASGRISLSGLALAAQATLAAFLLGGQYPEADLQTSLGMRALRAIDEFRSRVARVERVTAVRDAEPAGISSQPCPASGSGKEWSVAGRPRHAVRLESVWFGYPGAATPQLSGLDLELPAGQCTALVGLNGAGKTTLVKMLTRLYEPDSGRVSVDGVDLRDIPVSQWRAQISVVFQDFVRYEMSAADNIAFGAAHRPRDPAAVRRAAARAEILPVLLGLPSGLDTILSRAYQGGAELSGGQWQRIAIARALYAVEAGARLLILDEPTSALDARAEAEFFDSFVDLTRGMTSVLISHRFSSVRRADQIAVLDAGRIVELGTHASLLAEGGRYAALFNLQAERFSRGLNADGEIAESRFETSGGPR
jgi:ATP-binding cassette subfamily B protein